MSRVFDDENDERKVWVFLYDSYINRDLLNEVDISLDFFDIAKVTGFDIIIQPHANLIASFEKSIFGVLTSLSHTELERLYKDHVQAVLDEVYLPIAVQVQLLDGSFQPALCYIAPRMKGRPPENEYIDLIVHAAREYEFPKSYIKHLESFKTTNLDEL
jgi:hypothetical protein